MTPKKIKNAAETDVPIMPPTREKESKRSEIEAVVAATTIEVMITILRKPEEVSKQHHVCFEELQSHSR
jgi:hypothetical protein